MSAETTQQSPTEETQTQTTAQTSEGTQLKALPTVMFYQRMYAKSFGGNDQKAIPIFKEYESREKISRLRSEIYAIAQGRVSDLLCQQVVGLNKKAKFESYQRWAQMMMGLLASSSQ